MSVYSVWKRGVKLGEMKYTAKEAMIYSQRIAQLSKALWKAVERDWQTWIKPYDLNINEHHILWIAYHMKGATISDVAKFGVMHVSTAFNFSKKLEERGLLQFSKRDDDKRNTYVEVTDLGETLLDDMNDHYLDTNHAALESSMPLKDLYGRFPDFMELMAVIRNIYGDDFMEIFERGFKNLDEHFKDKDEVAYTEID